MPLTMNQVENQFSEMFKEGKYLCDFCGKEMQGRICDGWTYTTKPFILYLRDGDKELVNEVDEKWAACDECAALIEMEDRAGLLKRSVDIFIGKGEAPESERNAVICMINLIQTTFWDLRTNETEHPMTRERGLIL